MDNDIYLTPDGIKKVRDELEILIKEKRPELAQRLRAAIEMGDLSENADYISAKEDQGFIEGRILELEHILKTRWPLKRAKAANTLRLVLRSWSKKKITPKRLSTLSVRKRPNRVMGKSPMNPPSVKPF